MIYETTKYINKNNPEFTVSHKITSLYIEQKKDLNYLKLRSYIIKIKVSNENYFSLSATLFLALANIGIEINPITSIIIICNGNEINE